MRRIVIGITLLAAAGCHRPTAPGPSRYCFAKGDTLGVLTGATNGVITQCSYILAQQPACSSVPLTKPARCVLGEPFRRPT